MSWIESLVVFLRAAFLSVNGSTTLALLEEDLVDRLGVLTPGQFAAGVAIGSATPGPLGYGCIALGFLADGWRGALLATFTSWLPAFLALPLRAGYRRLAGRTWLPGLTWGVAAAGAGLLGALILSVGSEALTGPREVLIAAAALALLLRKLPLPLLLAGAAALGAAWLG